VSPTAVGGSIGRYSIHGIAVVLQSHVPALQPQVDALLAPFSSASDGPAASALVGTLRPYSQAEVLRHLSPSAVRLAVPGKLIEAYRDGERTWIVDDRWGMLEMNVLQGTWRSWLLPRPAIPPARCAERAVLRPLAELLRPRGLTLLPAAALARDGWGVLLISSFNIAAEMAALVNAGYRVIGQRWTALREVRHGAGRVEMLHIPSRIESRIPGVTQARALCDAVALIQPGRRAVARAVQLQPEQAFDALRRGWPIVELHRSRADLPRRLAQGCRCIELHLSHQPEDILGLLETLRAPVLALGGPTPTALARRFVPALVRR